MRFPWSARLQEADLEKAVPRSPTDSTTSGTTLGSGSRVDTADTKPLCSEKVDNAQKRTEALDRRRKEIAAREAVAKTKTIPLEDYPMGYPRLAAFQSSESSFSIYRSFDYLHGRVILNLQAELRDLEQELEILDDDDDTADDEEQQNRLKSRAVDLAQPISEREILLTKIHEKLLQYDEMLMKAREMNGFQRPSNRDYMSLRHWCFRKSPLVAREVEFVERKEDLVTLRQGREWAGFDSLVESSIKRLPAGLAKKLFTTPELRVKTDDKLMYYYSPARVEKLVGVLITLIIFVLLILPVVAMYKLTSIGHGNSTVNAVGLLVVFTLLFSAAMSLLTKAKRHELFAASAAYCAVLVVFISNFSNDGR